MKRIILIIALLLANGISQADEFLPPAMPFKGIPYSPQETITTGPAAYTTMNSAADLRKVFNLGLEITSGGTPSNFGFFPEVIVDRGFTGFNFNLSNASTGFYFQPGDMAIVETAPGITGYPITNVRQRAVNTLDVTNATSGYGIYSQAGHLASISNSSIPFGPSATNDKAVTLWTGVVSRQSPALFTGGPSGAQAYISWQNGPLVFGTKLDAGGGIYDGQIDETTGNLTWVNLIAQTSEQVITTTSATVSNNIGTVYLTGSGNPSITVTFPATPINGQELTLTLSTLYTAITLDGNGKTLVGGTMGVTAGSFARWKYRATDTTWYRVG